MDNEQPTGIDIQTTMRSLSELMARVAADLETTTGSERSVVSLLNSQLHIAHSTVHLLSEVRDGNEVVQILRERIETVRAAADNAVTERDMARKQRDSLARLVDDVRSAVSA